MASDVSRFAVWQLLRGPRRYGLYFTGAALTNLGNWAQNFAAVLLMYRLTGSLTQVGLVAVVQFGAPALLVRWTGSVADRYDRRVVIVVCQLMSAAATLVLVMCTVSDNVTPALVLGVMLVQGMFQAFQSPAQLALTPLLVTREQLDLALSLNAAQFNLARAVGPVLASMLVVEFGFAVVFGLNALTSILFACSVALLRPTAQKRASSHGSLRETLSLVRRTRYLTSLLLATFVVSGATDAATTLAPSYSILLTGSDAATGSLVAAFGAGAAFSAFFMTSWTQRFRRRLTGAMVFQLLGLILLVFAVNLPMALLALALSGGAFILGINRALSLVQGLVPPEMLGRVMALWGVSFATSRPLFAVVDGFLGDLLGVRWATAFGAAILAVATVLMLVQADRAARAAKGAARTDLPDAGLLETVVVDGVEVRYSVTGSGDRDLLLVHGYQEHHLWWHRMVPDLTKRWRVITLDLSGHGDSGRRSAYTIEAWVRELDAVLDATGSRSAVVAGHSMGGRVALAAGAMLSGRVSGVVTFDTPVWPEGRPEHHHPPGTVHATRDEAVSSFRLLPAQPAPVDDRVLGVLADYAVMPTPGGWTWKHDPAGRAPVDDDFLEECLVALSVAVRYVYAEHSDVVDQRMVDHMRAMVTVLEVIEVAGTHHHLVLEEPALCVGAIDGLDTSSVPRLGGRFGGAL